MTHTIGIDVGGTKIAGGLVSDDGSVGVTARHATVSDDYEALLDAIERVVNDCSKGQEPAAVGLAIAGNVDADGTGVLFSAHLPLAGEPLRDDLSKRVGLPVMLDNDANAAAWAEYRFGETAGSDDVLFVALGTGLGAGLIMDGRLRRGALGFAGEAGHLCVVRGGRECPCGSRGCWERYCSGTALLVAYLDRGGDPERSGPDITDAAIKGDPRALAALQDVGDWLGHGLASLVAVLDPGLIVVGGGVSQAGELLLEPALRSMTESMTGGGRRPNPILASATMGNGAGVVGAAELARDYIK